MSIVSMNAVQVTNTSGNHNKFYRVYIAGNLEIRHWGRIGTVGQVKRLRHSSGTVAWGSARNKISEQISRGYDSKMERLFTCSENADAHELAREWHKASPVNQHSSDPDTERDYYDEDEPDPRYQKVAWETA